MNSFFVTLQFTRLILAMAVFCLANLAVLGQDKYECKIKNKDFCSSNNYLSNDKVSYNETREVSLAAANLLDVDGKRNGGISIKGENRSDVLVRACVQTVGRTDEEARAAAKGIRIETGSQIRAEGAVEESKSLVSYEIMVPHATNLKILAYNGGIIVSSVEGSIELETTNGGLVLSNTGGSVRGKTGNGGVIVNFSGNSWRGSGLDVETTNGGVILSIPENYAARVEIGTVNGGLKSDINALGVSKDKYGEVRPKRISAELNGGGPLIRVVTTNGGFRINSSTVRNL
jgi:hypothetical protein